MIPRIIHFFWTSNDTPALPEDVSQNVRTWETHHPEFLVKVWSLEELRPLMADLRGLRIAEAVDASRFAAMKSDLIRLALLYVYGGFWSDLKNRCLAPCLDELLDGPPVFIEHQPTTQLPDKPHYLTNSLLGSAPGEPFWLECLREAVGLISKRSTNFGVFGTTGAGMIMRVMKRHLSGAHGWEHCILPQSTWGSKIVRTGAAYNANGQHWRERENTESIYI